MHVIHIRYNDFHAVLDAEALGKLPRMNFKKLLKLARRDGRNKEALRQLGEILQEAIRSAEAAHEKAKEELTAGWKYVDSKSRARTAIDTRRENNRLQNAVKHANAEMTSAKSTLKIFYEMEIN